MSAKDKMKDEGLYDKNNDTYDNSDMPKNIKAHSEYFDEEYINKPQNNALFSRRSIGCDDYDIYNEPSLRNSCPVDHDYNQNNQLPLESLKVHWKRERNRVAAKKSRDKKANTMKQLMAKEKAMEDSILQLKESISDYDTILKEVLIFIESSMGLEEKDRLILLYDCMCKLKRNDGLYISDSQFLMEREMIVTNDGLENFKSKIRSFLNDVLYEYNK
ncbi:hypothetical protein GVAV_001248 [Gurleya vavrai]